MISPGRDTPSSQMTEGDGQGDEPRQPLEFVPPTTTAKQSRFDLDDKFGKFQIKTLMEGELIRFIDYFSGLLMQFIFFFRTVTHKK